MALEISFSGSRLSLEHLIHHALSKLVYGFENRSGHVKVSESYAYTFSWVIGFIGAILSMICQHLSIHYRSSLFACRSEQSGGISKNDSKLALAKRVH